MKRGSVIIEQKIIIAASPETVFSFLVDPALMASWFGVEHTLDPRPGGVFPSEWHGTTSPRVYLRKSCRDLLRELCAYRSYFCSEGTSANHPDR